MKCPTVMGKFILRSSTRAGYGTSEYKADFKYRGRAYLSYDAFCKLWQDPFPHVKIRAYKQVSGKCYTCLILGFLRNKYRDDRRRDLINELHYFHRTAYMGERQTYYTRQDTYKR